MNTTLSGRRAAPAALVALLSFACQAAPPTSPSRDVEKGTPEARATSLDLGVDVAPLDSLGQPVNPAHVAFRAHCDREGLCTFTDRSRCPDAVRFWDFGDGTGAPGAPRGSVEHAYTSPGTYVVTLTTATCGVETKDVRVR